MRLECLDQTSIGLNLGGKAFPELSLIHRLARLLFPIRKQGCAITTSALIELEQLCLQHNIAKLRLEAGAKCPVAIDERIVQIK